MLISAVILCAALYLIARHEAEISFPVILMITVGVSVVTLLLSLVIGPFALLAALLVLAVAINRLCYLSWPKALAVTGIYAVANIAISVATHMAKNA